VLVPYVLPVAKIDAAEVLIELYTAGVGPWDAAIRAGWYPGKKPKFPLVLGTDGAGQQLPLARRRETHRHDPFVLTGSATESTNIDKRQGARASTVVPTKPDRPNRAPVLPQASELEQLRCV
jgi:hypothetical protein